MTAEYKKDREEDQNIGPEDIDPCTLYVGNLAQEITKEDMVKTYPTGRRIDIGYAKKMKYTRYAFVSFKNVNDSIEAFKKTHSTQMYSKSLIVRFRRLHGTVGMPGESKTQSPAKKPDSNTVQEQQRNENNRNQVVEEQNVVNDTQLVNSNVDLSMVKQEVVSSDDEDVESKQGSKDYQSPYLPGSIEFAIGQHRPIKQEIKKEVEDDDLQIVNMPSVVANGSTVQVKTEYESVVPPTIKNEHEDDGSNFFYVIPPLLLLFFADESSDDEYSGRIGDVVSTT